MQCAGDSARLRPFQLRCPNPCRSCLSWGIFRKCCLFPKMCVQFSRGMLSAGTAACLKLLWGPLIYLAFFFFPSLISFLYIYSVMEYTCTLILADVLQSVSRASAISWVCISFRGGYCLYSQGGHGPVTANGV